MLVQLHWQDRRDFKRTEFVAQGEFDSAEAMDSWVRDLIERRGGEMPGGWTVMVCNEDSEHFVRAAPP